MIKNKFFIRGVKGRGKEVIELLKSKGGKAVDNFLGHYENTLYFINNDDNIDFCRDYSTTAALFMEFCEELKLPAETFKDIKIGDTIFVRFGSNCWEHVVEGIRDNHTSVEFVQSGVAVIVPSDKLSLRRYKYGHLDLSVGDEWTQKKGKDTSVFRLPSIEEFEKLAKLKHEFKDGVMHVYEGENELVLPAAGYRIGTMVNNVGTGGYYWSSTNFGSSIAYYFYFNSSNTYTSSNNCRYYDSSVRLVSDTPFDGAIKMIGLYWKPENEEGYYTWYEAMKVETPKEDDSVRQAKVQEHIDKFLERQNDNEWKEHQEVYHEWLKIKDNYSFSDSDVAWKEAVLNYKNRK